MPKSLRAPRFLSFLFGSTALIGIAALPSAATAATVWTGTNSADWYTAGNWDNGVPNNATPASIVSNTPNPTVINGGSAFTGTLNLQGTAGVTIQNGGDLSSTGANIGVGFGSNATMTVTGAGSSLTADFDLVIGQAGTGTLIISNGAMVTDANSMVGALVGGIGEVTVDAASWNNLGQMAVGGQGAGTLTVRNGGTVSSASAVLGSNASGIGQVTVTGAGSNWSNDTILDVGLGATGSSGVPGGTLKVLDGGTVNTGTLNVATNAGSSGVVLIEGSGSAVAVTHDATIGFLGSANLTISNGGELNDVDGYVGRDVGGSGLVTVTGSGSEWNNSDDLFVGYNGFGELEILDGAAVSNVFAQVGALAGSAGKVTVGGAGSSWSNSSALIAGQSGFGELAISDGGVVTSIGGVLGGTASGQGVATVTGAGSSLSMTGAALAVGSLGRGGLSILDGGTVGMSSIEVGFQAGSLGNVVIDGAGSSLKASFLAYVGDQGDGTMRLSNGGTLAADTLVLGKEAGSTGQLIIGAELASAPAAAGRFTGASGAAPTLVFGNGNGSLILNHTSDNYAFDAVLDGDGDIIQKFGTTYLSTDSAAYSSLASVTDGKLVINALLANANSFAENGGTLGGTGTVRNMIAGSAGIIAPGNSIGTLHVANSSTFNTGSIYEAEVNAAGASDLIDVGGMATINGGNVAVLAAPGQYAPSTQYTIARAVGGVTGTYSGVTVNSAFLAASLTYDANDVFLTLDRINTTMFNDVGGTPNQQATGAGLDSAAIGNAAAEALAPQSDAAKRAALDQLSGELHASLKGAQLEDSRFVRDAINGRLLDTAPSSSVWSHGFGSFGAVNGDGNAAGLDRQTGGLFVGADGMLADGWRVGLLGGYGIGNYDVSERGSSASVESYNAAIYTGFEAGGFSFRLGADYAVQAIDTDRTIAFTGFSDEAIAAYMAQTAQVFGEVSYKLEAGAASFEPFAALAQVSQSTDGFSETGGAGALTAEADTVAATFATLGFRAATEIDLGEATATLTGSLGWRHAFGDVTPTSTMSFAGGELFSIAGVPLATDAAVVDLGLDLAVSDTATLGASYSGVISEAGYDYGAKARLGWQF